MKPRLYIDQKITAFVNKYKIYTPAEAGEKGALVAMAQQKRLAFKEKVWFYSDEAKTQEVFSFRAEKVMDIHGRYFVETPDGTVIGMFRKEFKKSLLNSSWVVMDKDGTELFRVTESSMTLAILRRFIGWVPFIGDILEIAIKFFRYHFVFTDIASGTEIGAYRKVTLFRDHYQLSVTDDAYAQLDWRVFAAMGVGLDALQSR